MLDEALDHYQSGNYEAAFALYAKMLEEEPENPEVLFMMSLCRQGQQRYDDAREHLTRAVQLHPDNALYHYTLGAVHLRTSQVAAATDAYRKAVELDPNNARVRTGLGYALMVEGDVQGAEEAFRTALRAQPESAMTHAHLGVVLTRQGRDDEALSALREAAELDPENAYVQAHLGRAFASAGHWAFAVQCYRNALQRNPGEIQLLLWLGEAAEQNDELDAAADAWRKVLQQGEQGEALIGMGRLHLRAGQPQQAANMLERARRLTPRQPEPLRLLALAYSGLGRMADARRELQDVAEDDVEARGLLVRLLLAEQRVDDAAEWLRSGAAADSNDAVLRAEVELARGNPGSARSALEALPESLAGHPAVLLLRARVEAREDPERARASCKELLELQGLDAETEVPARRLLAALEHRAGRYAEAWSALEKLPPVTAAMMAVQEETVPDGVDDRGDVAQSLEWDTVLAWPPRPPGPPRLSPVLVYGWPGSGRRRLLQALARHPSLQVINDRPDAQNERRAALCWPRGDEALTGLEDADWRLHRRRYRRQAQRALGSEPTGLVVDGMWWPAAALGPIQRLYPDAMLITLDAPLEDLLVKWRWTGFTDPAAMARAWRADRALLDQARNALQLDWVELDRDELVEEPETALRKLLEFWGLPWQEGMAAPLTEHFEDPPRGAGEAYRELIAPYLEEQ